MKTEKKANEPRTMVLREAMRRMGKRSKVDKIIIQTFREFDKKNNALEKWKSWVEKNLESYKDKISETMEADGTVLRSLVLIHQSGQWKVYITVRVTMKVDTRGEEALSLIRKFLDEYQEKATTDDPNIALMIELLTGLFTQRRKELIVTQGLLSFTKLERSKIPDKRLKLAYDLLKEAITSEESGPVVKLSERIKKKWVPYHTPGTTK